MKETQVSLKRTSLLSVVKNQIYLKNKLSKESNLPKEQTPKYQSKIIKERNPDCPIFAQININSIRNKFQFLMSQIISNVAALLVSETKLYDSFPTAQFLLDRFSKPYRLDRCSDGGGILLHIKDDISSRWLTDHRLTDNAECLFNQINMRNKKWLLCCLYNLHRNNISNLISHLSKGLNNYRSHYENILFLGDFNSQSSENCLNDFSMYIIFQILLKNQHVLKP